MNDEPHMSDDDKVIQLLREIQAKQAEPTEMLRQLREPIRMMMRLAVTKSQTTGENSGVDQEEHASSPARTIITRNHNNQVQ
jgi:hypothetical protein